jgi:SAM-dependent methyltransferase
MNTHLNPRRLPLTPSDRASMDAATIYNEAGDGYLHYADGDPNHIYTFDSHYAHMDLCVWQTIDRLLIAKRRKGDEAITILDAGCGPGSWLRRIVARCRALGFTDIRARGFDVADEQVERARELAADLTRLPGVNLTFDVGDLCRTLPECDASVDLCLCLYGVLNHLPVGAVSGAIAELARVTCGHTIVTVRAAGSTPTVFVDNVEQASTFRQDNSKDEFEAEMRDGRHVACPFHLFTAVEFRTIAEAHLEVEEVKGLDLFHCRFAADPRWNPPSCFGDAQFYRELVRLEEMYGSNPHFIDHAAHILLVAQPTRVSPQ